MHICKVKIKENLKLYRKVIIMNIKKIKSLLKIPLYVLAVIVALNYIPVKFAVSSNVNKLGGNDYLCSYAQVTGGNWEVENKRDFANSNWALYIDKLHGKSPFDVLNSDFTSDTIEPSGNRYVFKGQVIFKDNDIYDLNVEKWDIVFPITRGGIRILFTPMNYLTIYDYDWGKIFKKIFH